MNIIHLNKKTTDLMQGSFMRILLLLLYLLKIEFSFLPVALYRIVFLLLFMAMLCKRTIHIGKYDKIFIAINTFMLSFSLFRSSNTKDTVIAWYHFEMIVNILSAYIILEIFYRELPVTILIYEIVHAILIQSVLMIIMLLNTDIKSFINSFLSNAIDESQWSWRHVGLTGFTSYNIGVFLALSFSLSFYLFLKKRISFLKFGFLSVCFISTALVSARSSYVVFFFFGCYYIYYIKHRRILLFLIFVIVLFIITYINLYKKSLSDKQFKYFFDWVFSLINDIVFNKNSIVNNHSVKVIGDNFYWLPNLKTFLLGDGRYASVSGKGYYMATDAGYMRRLLYYGAFVSVFYYTFFALYIVVIKLSKKYTDTSALLIMMVIIVFFMQYKGDFFIDAGEYFRVFFLIKNHNFVARRFVL